MSATTDKTVRELALENPIATRVFEKLGIDYCCGGKPPFKFIASSLLGRRHLGQVIIRYPALSLGTKSGATSLFLFSERMGEAAKSFPTC